MAKRVLVVDDHAATRALVRAILTAERNEGYEIIEAGSGAAAFGAVDKDGPFDLILLDIELPDVDGYTICRALRQKGITTPVVFVTSKAEFRHYNLGREAGGDSYVVKPINRAALKSLASLFTNVGRKEPVAKKP